MAKIDTQVVELARTWLGTPHHHQACKKGIGVDCVGLVKGIYEELTGIVIPPLNYSWDWGEANDDSLLMNAAGEFLQPVKTLKPGRVIALRWKQGRVAKHLMVLTEEDYAIHCVANSGVSEIYLTDWWKSKIVQVFQFPRST